MDPQMQFEDWKEPPRPNLLKKSLKIKFRKSPKQLLEKAN